MIRNSEIVGHEVSAFEFRNSTTKEIPGANTALPHDLAKMRWPGVSPSIRWGE